MATRIAQDLRYALRVMRRNLGCTVTAVLVLAVAIGPNTAIFSIVDKVLFQPLPYPHADRLLQLIVASPMGNATRASIPMFITWREDRGAFEYVAGFASPAPLRIATQDGPELASGMQVSADYFALFGLRPALGRTFTRSDDVARGPRVAVIGDGLWRRRFGGERSIVGQTVRFDGEPYEVVGVLAPDATDAGRADVWLPLQADPDSIDHASWLQVVARTRPGVSAGNARLQIYTAAGEFHRRFPGTMGPYEHFGIMPLRDVVVGDARQPLLFLTGAVLLVLLTSCANVANLLLAQGSEREREFTVRAALGARSSTIIRQLLTECVVLAAMGGALGLALGWATLRGLTWINPDYLSVLGASMRPIVLDGRVIAFAFALLTATTVLFGISPTLRATRPNLTSMFGSATPNATAGTRHRRFGSTLVVAQFACALVLVLGAGLLIQALLASRNTDPGFVGSNVLTLEMPIAGPQFANTAAVTRVVETVESRLSALPDVAVTAASSSLPLDAGITLPFAIDRRPLLRSPFHGTANWRRVSRGYFEVLGMRLLAGRLLTRHDVAGARPVAIINESMARRFWPGSTAVDERITIAPSIRRDVTEPSRVIVGVVADVLETGLRRDVEPIVYVPIAQVGDAMNAFQNQARPLQWMIRTTADPRRLAPAIARELVTSSGMPIGRIRTMDEVVARSTARDDFTTALLTAFAAIAVLLAAVGLYGVTVQSIQQRRREIGVRLALGATPWSVRRLLLAQGLRLTAIGVVVGAAAALLMIRTMVAHLFGVAPGEPVVLASVALGVTGVALVAMLLAARRATAVDPVKVLS